jgi:hypothetical protein
MARKQSLSKEPLSTRLDQKRKFYGANLAEVSGRRSMIAPSRMCLACPTSPSPDSRVDRWRCSGRRPILRTAPCSSAWL